jgi:hypothetical protein
MMQLKGLGDGLCDWIMKVMRGGRVAIKVNDQVGPYFTTHAGVRKGDHLSPLLFDIVGDGLAMMIKKTKNEGIINGMVTYLVDEGVSILQYADDTILFLEDSLESARI